MRPVVVLYGLVPYRFAHSQCAPKLFFYSSQLPRDLDGPQCCHHIGPTVQKRYPLLGLTCYHLWIGRRHRQAIPRA